MKTTFAFFLFLFSTITFAQSSEELQGKWQLVKLHYAELSTAENKEINEEVCLKKTIMEFKGDDLTSYGYSGDDCEEESSDTTKFKVSKNTLKIWSEYHEEWEEDKLKMLKNNRFKLTYEDSFEGKTTLTFKKI